MTERAQWTEDEMRRALEEVKNGKPVLAVSKIYGIPRRTLRNHISSGSPNRKLGTRSVYVHEECVGLTKADKQPFLCPNCSP